MDPKIVAVVVIIVVIVLVVIYHTQKNGLGLRNGVSKQNDVSKKREPIDRNTLEYKRLTFLKSKGFYPDVIYDIGAHNGGWTHIVSDIFPKSTFYMFEANKEHEESLKSSGRPYNIGVLGNEEKQVTFYSKADTGDSIFREQSSAYEGSHIKEKKEQMQTLDGVVSSKNWKAPNFIKIDVQGAELLVLGGGQQSIDAAEVIMLETKILEYNKGAPMMIDIINYMNSKGFVPYDILEYHYLKSGELNELDVMFVKSGSKYLLTGKLF